MTVEIGYISRALPWGIWEFVFHGSFRSRIGHRHHCQLYFDVVASPMWVKIQIGY